MLEVKTILNKLHRSVRLITEGFAAKPGIWAYINSTGYLTAIANNSTSQSQPKVLKMIMNVATSDEYVANDIKVGRIATLEGIFRAAVDSDGFQKYDTQASPAVITYTTDMYLTPAYRTTSDGTSDSKYAAAADIGKLRPATYGDTVVAKVERFNGDVLEFITVSPKPYGGDDIWSISGSGSIVNDNLVIEGEADHVDAVVITVQDPLSDAIDADATISYTLSKECTSGSATFTRVDGTADPASPQVYAFAGTDLDTGTHVGVDTSLPLVSGTIYDVTFEATDIDGIDAVPVVSTNVTVA